MRTLSARRGPEHEEEESVFVSMTDMTVSFLFIVMILLAFFASRFNDEETVPLNMHQPVVEERDALRIALDRMEEQLLAAQVEVVDLKTERSRLRNSLVLVEIERDEAQVALAARDRRIVDFEAELAALNKERDTLLKAVSELESNLASVNAQVEALREALLQAQSERDTARKALAERENRISVLKAEMTALTAEHDILLQTVLELKSNLASATARIEALRESLLLAQRERDTAKEALAERETSIAELEIEIKALTAEIERLSRPDPLKTYIAQVAEQREQVLRQLRDVLLADFPELEGVITSESDVLRFQGEGLFASGSDALLDDRIPLVERIAERLDALLPCYTFGEKAAYSLECNPALAVIEAVQIEGHTDSDGADALNVALSARRGAATYAAMTAHEPGLIAHHNLASQPVLSIAGYGEGRPVIGNDTVEGKSTNRRIDLRFIMVTPGESAEIGRIRDRLLMGEGP